MDYRKAINRWALNIQQKAQASNGVMSKLSTRCHYSFRTKNNAKKVTTQLSSKTFGKYTTQTERDVWVGVGLAGWLTGGCIA
jgi:hypothetical protein